MGHNQSVGGARSGNVLVHYVSRPWRAIGDLLKGIVLWRIWTALSAQEFGSVYRRSSLGILWVILSFAGFMFIKLTIFSSLLDVGTQGYYDTYLLLGFFVWFYLAPSVSAAPDTFIANQAWIKSEPLPLSVYVYKSVLRELYSFLLTSLVAIIGVWWIGYEVSPISVTMALLAVPMFVVSSCAAKILLGTIGAKFRDIPHLVKAIMMPMMFLTPIFWMPSQMESLMVYLWWNPFYHYIEILRAPLLVGELPIESWIFVGYFSAGMALLGFIVFARYRERVVFWF